MILASLVYRQYLTSGGVPKKIWKQCRRFLIKRFNDPSCTMRIHGKLIQLPLSHGLPELLALYPHYDRLPGRLCEYLYNKNSCLRCIDVGANIGDSIAALYKHDNSGFLAIEPNPKFYRYLNTNWGRDNSVTTLQTICSSLSARDTFTIHESHSSTSSLLHHKDGLSMQAQSLDDIVAERPIFSNCDLLKIDTDGHDCQVIGGAKKVISQNRPAILLECDAFANTHYVDDYLQMLSYLKDVGYNSLLLYDNYGYLVGKHSLDGLFYFINLLFYQLTKVSFYFDVLLLKDEDIDSFHRLEHSYFIDTIPDQQTQKAAALVAKRCWA